MTQEERRIKILEKRLRLLAEYLDTFGSEDANAPSFAQFVKSKGITREMFIKDLPPELSDVPGSGYDRVLEYALVLQEVFKGIHNFKEMEQIAADGNSLERGYIKYQPGQYIREDCGCDGGGGDVAGAIGDDKSSSADGNNHEGEEPYLPYIFQEGTEDGLNFAASGCGLPPIPPPFPNPKKVKNPIQKAARKAWDKYKEKHAKYRRCVNAQKEKRKEYTAKDKLLHAQFLSMPSWATFRAAFLRLIEYNIFGLASTFNKMRQDPNQDYWKKVQKKFYQFGGSEKKLDQNTSIGMEKKPIFKPKGWKPKGGSNADGEEYRADGSKNIDIWFNAEGWTAAGIATLITAAMGIISQMAPIIKSFKKDKGEPDIDYEGTPDPNSGGDVPEGNDPGGLPTEGLSTGAWIGISVGAALVLGVIGYFAFKGPSKNG